MIADINITYPDDAWDHSGNAEDPTARLTGGITINGHLLHLTAIAIKVVSRSGMDIQQAFDPADEEEFAELHAAFHADGHYETVTIGGRKYVIFGDLAC